MMPGLTIRQCVLAVVLTCALVISVMLPAWAAKIKEPGEMAGAWRGSNNSIYEIEVNRNQVTLKAPTRKKIRHYKGKFLPNRFKIYFPVRSVDDISEDIPLAVRRIAVRRGHIYEGEVEFLDDGRIKLRFREDSITYNPAGTRLLRITTGTSYGEVILTRKPGYTIGKLRLQDRPFRKRIHRWQDCYSRVKEHVEHVILPNLQAEAQDLLSQMDYNNQRIASHEARLAAIEQQIPQLQQQIRDGMNLRSQPEYGHITETIRDLQHEVREIESQMAQYIKDEQLGPEYVALNQRFENKQAQLDQLWGMLPRDLPDIPDIERMKTRIETLIQEKKETLKALKPLYEKRNTLRTSYEENQWAIWLKENEMESVSKQLESLNHHPVIRRVVLTDGKTPVYEATLEIDPAKIREFQEAWESYLNEYYWAREQLKNLEPTLTRTRLAKQSTFHDMMNAFADVDEAHDVLQMTLKNSRNTKMAVETAHYLYDVADAWSRGGPIAVLVELNAKMIEHYWVNDGEFFKMFDESELRKLYNDEAYAAMQNPFAAMPGDQLQRSIIKTGTEVVYGLWEEPYLKRELAKAEQNLENVTSGHRNLIERARQARRRVPDINPRRLSDACDKVLTIRNRLSDMAETRRLTIGTKNTVQAAAEDLLKESIKAYMDQQEAAAWMDYFQKELVRRLATQNYLRASAVYWSVVDRKKYLQDYMQAMQRLRFAVEKQKEEYINSHLANNGFHVAQNRMFYPENKQFRMEITLEGMSNGEKPVLLGQKSPLLMKPVADYSLPERTLQTYGVQCQVGVPVEAENPRSHAFTFSGGQLKNSSKAGSELPLLIDLL